MAVNTAFHTNNVAALASEQNLYADLVKEAIQIYGHDVHYVDRTLIALDDVLGEDSLSQFTEQAKIEMYVEDSEGGYQGDKEILSQFGLENRNEITFVVNKTRFQDIQHQISIETATDTTSGSILLEDGTITSTTTTNISASFEEAYLRSEDTATNADRPQEGDLVYHPIVNKIFEIYFVDHDEPFHQLDNNPVFKLKCRQFEYSSETLDTGVTEIDVVEDELSIDSLQHQITLEQSGVYNERIRLSEGWLLNEDGSGDFIIFEDDDTSAGESILLESDADSGDASYIIQEDYIIGDRSTDKTAQNEFFEGADDTVLDFSESNPFGDVGSSS